MTEAASPPPPPAQDDAPRPATLLAAVAIAALEAAALVVTVLGIVWSGITEPGSIAAPFAEAAIYIVMGLGVGLVARGLWARRRWARTPFVVVQLFGLVVGWTLLSGDGAVVHAVGAAIGVLSLGGLACVFLPATGAALDR